MDSVDRFQEAVDKFMTYIPDKTPTYEYDIELDYSVMQDKPKGKSYTPPSLKKVKNRKQEIRNKNRRVVELRKRNEELGSQLGSMEETLLDLHNYTVTLEQALWRANIVAELGKDTELVPTNLIPNKYPLIKTKYELQDTFSNWSVTSTHVSSRLALRIKALRTKWARQKRYIR